MTMKLFEIDTDKILEATSKGIDEIIKNIESGNETRSERKERRKMTKYQIIDNSKEFECPSSFEILALCDKENNVYITMKKEIDEAIQNKSNLYELIIEKIEQGSFFEIEGFKCFCLKRKELRKGDFI